jgi:hypothetical protein
MRWMTMLWVVVATAQGIGAADECYAPVPCEPDFAAYEVNRDAAGAALPWSGTVVDEFGAHDVTALRVRRLLAPVLPADVKGTHAVALEVTSGLEPPRVVKTFDTALGRVEAPLHAGRFLIVPASKRLLGDGEPPLPPSGPRYACYSFRDALGGRAPYCFTDQFGEQCVSLGRTSHVCLPTVPDLDAPPLVCLSVRDAAPQDRDVVVRAATAPVAVTLNLDPLDELCLRATEVVP